MAKKAKKRTRRVWHLKDIRKILQEYKKAGKEGNAGYGAKGLVLAKYGITYSHINFWRNKYNL